MWFYVVLVNPCRCEFIPGNINVYWRFLTLPRERRQWNGLSVEDKAQFNMHSQCHGAWWYGHTRARFLSPLLKPKSLGIFLSLRSKWLLKTLKKSETKVPQVTWSRRRGQVTFQHYIDVIMTTVASQITSITVVYSIVYSDADERKHQSSASLAFVWGIHRDQWTPRTKGQ